MTVETHTGVRNGVDIGCANYVVSITAQTIRALLVSAYPEDIDIEITGLRPGEKLYEELLADTENTLPTYHKKIMISKVRDVDYTWVETTRFMSINHGVEPAEHALRCLDCHGSDGRLDWSALGYDKDPMGDCLDPSQ